MASNVLSSHGAGSTPIPKSRFGVTKLVNSIRGTSPLLRTPGATVSVNNDDEERKQRRLVSHLRSIMSPTCSVSSSRTGNVTSRVYPSETRGSSLSNTQIAEHYANCIKLSSENKITARNAFGLHLIDYMLEMLQKRGELSNFQVAGCTLDASAKIYAGRVDSIYSAAYKVLGGLGRGNTKDEETESDSHKPISKESKKESLTIERNQRVLDLLSFDLEFEVDPVSKKLSTALDECGDDGLLLHHLQSYDDYLVALDSSELPTLKDSDTKPEILNYEKIQGFNVSAVNTLQMCPTFSTFTFADDQNMNNFDLEEYSNPCQGDGYLPLQPDYSMLPCPTVHDDSGSDDVLQLIDAEENVSSVDYKNDILAIDETAEQTTIGVCGDNEVACVFPSASNTWECQRNAVQPIWMGNLCLTDALQPSEYSYFDSSVVQTNGHLLNFQTHGTKLESKRKVIRKRKQPFKIIFSDIPSEEILPMKVHNRTKGSSKQARKTMLPWDLCIKDDILFRLFCQQNWKLQRQKTRIINEDQLEDAWYNYENPNDSAHYCSLSMQEEQDESQYILHYTDRMNSMNIFSDNISQVLHPEKVEHLELVAQPIMVQKVNIDYSRNMKKIDAKKLKCTMWDIISGNTESTNSEEKRCMKFTDLYSQLPQYFHTSAIQDISISICFVFLMHLANQKGLKIWKQDLNNFVFNVE